MTSERMIEGLRAEYRRIAAEDTERHMHQMFGVEWACTGCRAIVIFSGVGAIETETTLRHESSCTHVQ